MLYSYCSLQVGCQGAMLDGTWCGKDRNNITIRGGFVLCVLSDISDNQPPNCNCEILYGRQAINN